MRKRLLILIMGISLLAPMNLTAYAKENNQELVEVAAEEASEATEETASETTEAAAKEVETPAEETVTIEREPDGTGGVDGDEQSVIEAMTTKQSEETPCQINFVGILPDMFGLNCYAQIMNDETGLIYNIPMYATNNYSQRLYVPEGTYTITEIKVFNDNTNTYPMLVSSNTKPDVTNKYAIVVSGTETCDVQVTLKDYDNINTEIQTKIAKMNGLYAEPEPEIYDPNAEAEETKDIAVKSTWPIKHGGTGAGLVGVEAIYGEGTQTAQYDISIVITKSGNLGEATFKYTLDDGLTYSEDIGIPLSGTYEVPGTGLAFNFNVSTLEEKLFVEKDYYSCSVPDPATSVVYRQPSTSTFQMTVTPTNPEYALFNILEDNNYHIIIKITKAGKFDTKDLINDYSVLPVYQLSLDGGLTYTNEDYFPQDCTIPLEEQGLTITFEGEKGHTNVSMSAGSVFECYPVRNQETDLTPILFVLAISAAAALFFYIAVKKSKIPQKNVYRFNPYTPVEVPEVKKKEKKVKEPKPKKEKPKKDK